LIGRSKSETSEQSGTDQDQNNGNKNREKGAILLQLADEGREVRSEVLQKFQ
jgi:hypothetical protein